MKKLFYILLFVLSFLFYWGTAGFIENRTEAEDAFEYALMVEQGAAHAWFYHPHHLLYGPVMKLGYKGVQALGYDGRAHGFLMMVSALSAAGSLLFFFRFCYRRYSLRPVSSLLATGLLAATYGFWRYAAEAEIVLPASLLVLAALYFSTDEEGRPRSFFWAIVFSILAVLMHIMNCIAVFFAIPCFYLLLRRWKTAVAHVFLCGVSVAAIFALVDHTQGIYWGTSTTLSAIALGDLAKGAVALNQCMVSGDFMLGFRSVRAFLAELFASRMLLEEFFLGSRLSRPLVLFSLATFLLYALLYAGCLMRAGWIWKSWVARRDRFQLPKGIPVLLVVVVWFLGYAGLLFSIEPGNPELWVMGLVPIWLLFCGLVLLPLTVDNRLWLPFAMMVVLFIHNGVGGIGLLGDPAKDYQRQKAAWLLQHATADDVVVTAGNPVFERYLRYHFPGTVEYLYDYSPAQLDDAALPATQGTLYVMGDVFRPVKSLGIRFPERSREITGYAEKIRPQVECVVENEFGGIYRLRKEAERF